MSDAEKKKHQSVFHHTKKGDATKIWKKEHRCLFISEKKRFNLLFQNENQLKEHKKIAGHTLKRNKPDNAKMNKKRKKYKKMAVSRNGKQ